MAVSVTHAHQTVIPDDGSDVGANAWNAVHTVTGLAAVATTGAAADVSGLAPSATTDTTNAANISTGTLPAGRLPNPSTTTLGGVQAVVAIAHQWIASISNAGVPSLSQPAAGDISGLAPSATTDTTNAANISTGTLPAGRLPNPSAATLGGIQSIAAVSHQWVASISTAGVPALSQPAAADLSDGVTGAGGAVMLAQGPTFAAGTTGRPSYKMTNGVLETTPAAGDWEYDGTLYYASTDASTRGYVPSVQMCILTSPFTLVSQTAAQAMFNSSVNGAVTLPIGVYEFECEFSLSSLSASSGTIGFALGGAATFTQAWWFSATKANPASANAAQTGLAVAANTAITSANTTTTAFGYIRGIIRVTVAGTVIPQVSMSVAAAAVVAINSYCKVTRIAAGATATIGNWS